MAYTVESEKDGVESTETVDADNYLENQNGYLIEFYKGDKVVFAIAKYLVRSIKMIPEGEEEKD